MDKQPIIGITTDGRDKDKRFTVPADYIDAVRRAGGVPILLPPGESQQTQLLPILNGLILSGGEDIDPVLYQGCQHETIYMVDPERDRSEIEITQKWLAQPRPLLCICRGIQILNVALGGTLIEHLPDVVGNKIAHRLSLDNHTSHPVLVESGSRLAEILGETEVCPVSWHHQAIRQTADGLNVVAYAADGTIEAVEKLDHPWLIGVQWHPEMSAVEDVTQQRLFDALVAVARQTMI